MKIIIPTMIKMIKITPIGKVDSSVFFECNGDFFFFESIKDKRSKTQAILRFEST